MKHDPYSLTELIRNERFIAWVRNPDEATEAFWQQFLAEFPEKRAVIEDAKGYVNLLAEDTGKDKPSIEQSKKMWHEVKKQIHAPKQVEKPTVKLDRKWQWIRIAASVVLMLGIGSYWLLNQGDSIFHPDPTAQNKLNTPTLDMEKLNTSSAPMTVLLEDGSSVVLQPGALLRYTEFDHLEKREVSLIGKAFFEIYKDAKRPFYVYTDGLVTKVLGTSFSIDAPKDSDKIKVEVKTGKVSVFATGNHSVDAGSEVLRSELKGIVLERDQKMAIYRQTGKPVTLKKMEKETGMEPDISTQLFIFDETPASEVFAALERAYHIKIIYNKSLLESCPLNATLIGQPFNEKLSAICVALDATYEIKNNEVYITGEGCK
jgi:transmembrane sensor